MESCLPEPCWGDPLPLGPCFPARGQCAKSRFHTLTLGQTGCFQIPPSAIPESPALLPPGMHIKSTGQTCSCWAQESELQIPQVTLTQAKI